MEKNKQYPYSMENNTPSSLTEDGEPRPDEPSADPRLQALWNRHTQILETKKHIAERVDDLISELVKEHPDEEDLIMKSIQGQYEILLKQRDLK